MGIFEGLNFFKKDEQVSAQPVQPDFSDQNVNFGAEVKKRSENLDAQGAQVEAAALRVISSEAEDVGLSTDPKDLDAARAQESMPEKTE